jgi:hypothetical protein
MSEQAATHSVVTLLPWAIGTLVSWKLSVTLAFSSGHGLPRGFTFKSGVEATEQLLQDRRRQTPVCAVSTQEWRWGGRGFVRRRDEQKAFALRSPAARTIWKRSVSRHLHRSCLFSRMAGTRGGAANDEGMFQKPLDWRTPLHPILRPQTFE